MRSPMRFPASAAKPTRWPTMSDGATTPPSTTTRPTSRLPSSTRRRRRSSPSEQPYAITPLRPGASTLPWKDISASLSVRATSRRVLAGDASARPRRRQYARGTPHRPRSCHPPGSAFAVDSPLAGDGGSGLVRDHDELRAVATVQLVEQPADVLPAPIGRESDLGVVLADEASAGLSQAMAARSRRQADGSHLVRGATWPHDKQCTHRR
jgi:hypothetical protein